MSQPYRNASVRPICTVCKDTAEDAACPRCKAPLCHEHALAPGERCSACEELFELAADERKRDPLRGWQVLLCYGVGAGVAGLAASVVNDHITWSSFEAYALFVLAVSTLAALLPLFAIHYRRRRLRPLFLSERPEHKRLRVKIRCEPTPAPRRPWDDLSIGSILSSAFFFIPLMPLIGGILGLVVLGTRKRRRERRGVKAAIWMMPVGIAFGGCHVAWFVSILTKFPFS